MKQTVSGEISAVLKEKIQSGFYPLGTKLPPEMDLCKNLGISRASLREAYRFLEAAGYVELKPGKGAFVAPQLPDPSDHAQKWLTERQHNLREILEVRQVLEPWAAELAAGNISANDSFEFEEIHRRYETAYHTNDVNAMMEADEYFHEKIAEMSGNQALLSMLKLLNQNMRQFRQGLFSVFGNGVYAIEFHKTISERILAGDAPGARAAMETHTEDIFRNLSDLIR